MTLSLCKNLSSTYYLQLVRMLPSHHSGKHHNLLPNSHPSHEWSLLARASLTACIGGNARLLNGKTWYFSHGPLLSWCPILAFCSSSSLSMFSSFSPAWGISSLTSPCWEMSFETLGDTYCLLNLVLFSDCNIFLLWKCLYLFGLSKSD